MIRFLLDPSVANGVIPGNPQSRELWLDHDRPVVKIEPRFRDALGRKDHVQAHRGPIGKRCECKTRNNHVGSEKEVMNAPGMPLQHQSLFRSVAHELALHGS
jgi:hypothetical protein